MKIKLALATVLLLTTGSALAGDYTEATDPIILACKRLLQSPQHNYQLAEPRFAFLNDAKFCRCVKQTRVKESIEATVKADPSYREVANMTPRSILAEQVSVRFKLNSEKNQAAQDALLEEDMTSVMSIAFPTPKKYAKMKCPYE